MARALDLMEITSEYMKKKTSRLGKRIEKLRKELGLFQSQFADRLRVTQATVSAWEAGDKKRAPSSEALFRLGSLAKSPDDKIYFWGLAGLDEQGIREAASQILENIGAPPEPGQIVRVPRFRFSDRGRDRAGEDIPLPAEFIPNPLATICFVSDREPGGL